MDESSLLKKRNMIKAGGTLAAVLGALFSNDPNSLLVNGPGVATGFFVLATISCVVYLAKTKG